MIGDRINKLKQKTLELKENYEISKKKREELSNELHTLDTKIEELEREMQDAKTYNEKGKRTIESLKPKFNKFLNFITNCNIVCLILNAISKTFGYYLIQLTISLLMGTAIYIVPELVSLHKENKKKKKYTKKDLKKLENEHNEIVRKRVKEGFEYKNIREQEIEASKLYLASKEVLDEEMKVFENEGKTQPEALPDIDLSDIYYKIKVDISFYTKPKEVQKGIFEEKLKEYIIEKISQNFHKFKKEVLAKLTIEDLVSILIKLIPSEDKQNLNHIIHAILGFAGNMQGYSIVWYEEEDTHLIKEPQVVINEDGKWEKLITHKNTPYELIFTKTYDTFINDIMIENKDYTRKRDKNNHV